MPERPADQTVGRGLFLRMKIMRSLIPAAVLVAIAGCSGPAPSGKAVTAAGPVSLKIIRWPELEQAIAAHRGSIIVIDLWAEY